MLRLHTLGELRLEDADGRTVLRRRKPLVLLAYICRRGPRPVPRAELVDLLWGARAESKARQSLRQALLELRQHVGEGLAIEADSVALPEGAVEMDLALLERDEAARRDRAAVEQWSGEFLAAAEIDADLSLRTWIETERAALRRRLGLCFDRLLDAAERRGDWHEAIALGARWCEAAPLDERAASRLIGAFRAAGRHGAAVAAHATFVARLREGVDAAPSASFTALGTSIEEEARDDPAGRDASPVVLSFIGRGDAFVALMDAWRRAVQGRVTVALIEGGAGMGASRLCAELATSVAGAHRDALVLRADYRGRAPNASEPRSAARALCSPLGRAAALGGMAPSSLRALRTLLPEIATRFPRLESDGGPISDEVLADALREALLAVSDDGPVLVIADALSRADAASRAIVLSVAAMTDAPILLAVAERTADIDDDAALAALRETPAVVRVPLGPLDARTVASGVDGRADVVERLHADTGGVPAYLVAHLEQMLADHVATSGASGQLTFSPAADGRPPGLPPAARALVRDVARPLDNGAHAVLDALGVFGAPLAVADAASLAELASADAEPAVAALVHCGLARRTSDPPGGIMLDPPIVARAAYELVPVLKRERLHAACSALLASRRGQAYDRSRLGYHEEHGRLGLARPRSMWRTRSVWTLAAMAVVAVAAWALTLRPRATSAGRQRTVAVFPFAVRGGADLSFLQSGMVSLLSTSLDGAAGLHTLDPRTVLAGHAALPNDMTPDAARGEARHLGAALFIVGDAVDANKQLALTASLYSTNGGAPIATARAEGREDDLFGLVDRLSAELAVSQGSTSRGPAMQLGALTTSSLPALKAYLEGEAAYRENDMFAAKAAFERATEADSTFSLAWYGEAATASWMLMSKTERYAAEQAVRTSGRLSERNRTLIAAFAAFARGDADSAERLASEVADRYDDVEAWVILGEVLYHHNWKRGRSLAESRRPFERVLALDPKHWPALQHLAEVAAIEGNRDEADSLLVRYESLVGPEHTLPSADAFRRFAFGTAHDRADFIAHMKDDRGFWLITSIFYVSVFARDLNGARSLARELVDPVRPPEQRGFGEVMLAHLDAARGRWHDARADLALATAYVPLDAVEHEALLALAPFVDDEPGARDARVRLVEQLRSAPPAPPADLPWRLTDETLQPMLRAYLSGMLGARDGDAALVATALRALDSLPDPTGTVAIKDGLRFAIHGEQARAGGTPATALAAFERSARATPWVTAWTSAFVSQAYERYARAELLHQLGRDEEALHWYATFDQNSPYDLVYLGPALYRQGQILEAHGRRAEAAAQYARFVSMWRDCDPELKHFTDDASRRLAALRPDSARR